MCVCVENLKLYLKICVSTNCFQIFSKIEKTSGAKKSSRRKMLSVILAIDPFLFWFCFSTIALQGLILSVARPLMLNEAIKALEKYELDRESVSPVLIVLGLTGVVVGEALTSTLGK